MSRFHPCCGGSLQTGTRIIAIFEIVVAAIFIGMGILSLVIGGFQTTQATKESEEVLPDPGKEIVAAESGVFMALAIACLIIGVILLIIAILLYQGATQRNALKCKIWLIISLIIFVTGVVDFVLDIKSGIDEKEAVHDLTGLVLNFYCMWVVYFFMLELKEEVHATYPPKEDQDTTNFEYTLQEVS